MTTKDLPVGVFDSGLGGLTAFAELRRLMPDEDLVYFGDNARIPYGTKSPEVIAKFAMQDVRFLMTRQVKAILVACGTVSSTCLPMLKKTLCIPIIGVVGAAAKKACEVASEGRRRIAVLGTGATIRSGAFEKEIALHGEFETVSRACAMFVPLVENGYTSKDDVAANAIAKEYLADIADFRPDAVILGCTHYPLLSEIISSFLPDSVLISSGYEAAHELFGVLTDKKLVNPKGHSITTFYTSDDAALFASGARAFLGRDLTHGVMFTDIERY